jgi:hypothetical protein
MQERAAALGLGLQMVDVGPNNYQGRLHDSYHDFLDGLYSREYPPFYRPVSATPFGNEVLDPTIDLRRRDVALVYQPPNAGLPMLAG